ncbi:MAG TPA: DegT/DnrJ/EryC1/StrS family aminotransferase [Chitinivibrionales bacterium]|nr:DegT/DnrJ/EryC1/StrS family aminotransferase [Chitinivibrionales bacterium]
MEKIPVFVPHISADTHKHLADAFEVGWLGMGAFTKEFEDRVAGYIGLTTRKVLATNTGTSALHIGLLAAGVKPGDEVITPSFNYVADHQAITATGGQVVMCDINDDNLGIDCEKAEELITKKTKAIIPLHFAGIPCDIDGVYKLAKKHNLRVVEDCCHAFGSTIDGRKIGSFGDIACFSFDPVKVITSIDGGAVVVNSEKEMEQLRHLRLLGVDKDTTLRYKNQRAWDYDVVCQGFRYHMTNILASVGISQIKRVDEFIESRRRVCKAYNEAFKSLEGVKVPQTDFSNVSPFIYSLRVLDGKREKLIDFLRTKDIDTGIHFVPVHKHTFYKSSRHGDMSVTDRVIKEVLTLPLHSNMKPQYIERVIGGVCEFYRK